jgi:hypothetical protein
MEFREFKEYEEYEEGTFKGLLAKHSFWKPVVSATSAPCTSRTP